MTQIPYPNASTERRVPKHMHSLAVAIWAELIAACEAFYHEDVTVWAGDSSAPEFTDEQVKLQFQLWNTYLKDYGALGWQGNNTRKPYDFETLPDGMQRSVCERVWRLCKDAKLDESDVYKVSHRNWTVTMDRVNNKPVESDLPTGDPVDVGTSTAEVGTPTVVLEPDPGPAPDPMRDEDYRDYWLG